MGVTFSCYSAIHVSLFRVIWVQLLQELHLPAKCAVPRISWTPFDWPRHRDTVLMLGGKVPLQEFSNRNTAFLQLRLFFAVSALLDTLNLHVHFLTYACHLKTIYMCFRFVWCFKSDSIAWCLKVISTQHFSFSCHLDATFDPSLLCHPLFPSKLPLCISAWRRTYGTQDPSRVSVKMHGHDSFFVSFVISTSSSLTVSAPGAEVRFTSPSVLLTWSLLPFSVASKADK